MKSKILLCALAAALVAGGFAAQKHLPPEMTARRLRVPDFYSASPDG